MNNGQPLAQARAAKPKALAVFQNLLGDVAVGITAVGGGLYGLKINLTSAPTKGLALPQQIDGVPVQVEVVGRIRKR